MPSCRRHAGWGGAPRYCRRGTWTLRDGVLGEGGQGGEGCGLPSCVHGPPGRWVACVYSEDCGYSEEEIYHGNYSFIKCMFVIHDTDE